ncbi:indole-3-acetaldehyde oxidase-like [Hordeum vulgare subsp. vulgare]|uniref:indole-3-acetaldehyde oxidase-like n=1 Tax=Hordeum vulgare subsp. vulgare TaxID=112509 RepID=UPI001D1A3D9A|nr:indole-3-acetaldehyde oxidase-like [Hordeum vulgare subsp. vulgare]
MAAGGAGRRAVFAPALERNRSAGWDWVFPPNPHFYRLGLDCGIKDWQGIPELSFIERSSKGVEIGAAVSISKAIEVFSDGTPVFRKIASHLSKVASPFIRNTGTIGGNVIMAQRLPFASDIVTVLLTAGSTVTIQTASKMVCLTLEEFLEQPPCDAKTILLIIFVPDWGSDSVIFETSRAATRPFGNVVSYVNSAFLARTSQDAASEGFVIEDICLAFGAYGVDHATRARKVEEFLKGKSVSAPVILEAVQLLKDVISPSEGTTHPEYRVSLAVSFLFSFLSSLGNNLNALNGSCVNGSEKHGKVASNDLPIRSRQELVFNDEYKLSASQSRNPGPICKLLGRLCMLMTSLLLEIASMEHLSTAHNY